jgi:hypothetical protein
MGDEVEGGGGRERADQFCDSLEAHAGEPKATGQPPPGNHPSAPSSGNRSTGTTTGLSASEFGVPDQVPCPFCAESETELHSAFGGQLSTSTYWCHRCRTAFEWFKWEKR